MKNKIISIFLAFVLLFSLSITLSGCFDMSGGSGNGLPNIDNTTDLNDYIPSQDDDYDENDELYTSNYLSFVTEINGSYTTDRPFSLDENNPKLRIYDNIYFYKYDFFQMMSNDYRYIWCSLSDETDLQYAEVEREQGEDIQTNIKVSGIYKVVFDTSTFLFDLVYKSEITNPVYEEIKDCDIHSTATGWTTMQKNGDEFCVNNYHMERAKVAAFDSSFSHTSHYKTTIDESCLNKYVCKSGTKPKSEIWFMISGTYNIYLNAKTYVVRVELVSADEDGYTAGVYENSQFSPLELVDESVDYIFKYRYEATSDIGGYGVMSDDVPRIFNASLQEYKLAVTTDTMTYVREYSSGGYYFKTVGTYDLIINLADFTISINQYVPVD